MVPERPRLLLEVRSWMALSHLTVLLLPLLALLGTGALAQDLWRQTQDDIDHQATLWRLDLEYSLAQGLNLNEATARAAPRMALARAETLAGVRVVDAQGIVLASATGTGIGDDTSDNTEVQQALSGESGVDIRAKGPSKREVDLSSASRLSSMRVYVAQPLRQNDQIVGAVLISRTPREEIQTFYQMGPQLSLGLLFSVSLTLSIAFWMGNRFSRSLHALAETSKRIASGETDITGALKPALNSHVIETRLLAQAMETMRLRLQDRLRYISEFASNVSHEFKTPVTTLRGTLELLRDDEDMPPPQRLRFLDNALSDLERLSRLVGGLMALARAEEGGGRQNIDLHALIQLIHTHHVSQHPQITLSGQAAHILGNTSQIESVLNNLIQNALRYGAPPLQIHAFQNAQNTGFSVSDAGPGISEANQAKIFDRFFTTARAAGGTGLGLALVRTICIAHGGQVTVESRPGYTCFTVSFPRNDL